MNKSWLTCLLLAGCSAPLYQSSPPLPVAATKQLIRSSQMLITVTPTTNIITFRQGYKHISDFVFHYKDTNLDGSKYTWYLLSTTNITLPTNQWTVIPFTNIDYPTKIRMFYQTMGVPK